MVNICQITNQDISTATIVSKNIPNLANPAEMYEYPYRWLNPADPEDGPALLKSRAITKFGYCTNSNQGMNYPIFLAFQNNASSDPDFKMYMLGKTGMYEFQTEEWQDVNSEDEEEQKGLTANPELMDILVPDGIPFVLDYCYIVGGSN